MYIHNGSFNLFYIASMYIMYIFVYRHCGKLCCDSLYRLSTRPDNVRFEKIQQK